MLTESFKRSSKIVLGIYCIIGSYSLLQLLIYVVTALIIIEHILENNRQARVKPEIISITLHCPQNPYQVNDSCSMRGSSLVCVHLKPWKQRKCQTSSDQPGSICPQRKEKHTLFRCHKEKKYVSDTTFLCVTNKLEDDQTRLRLVYS